LHDGNEGGHEVRKDKAALYSNIVYVKGRLSDIDFFIEESKWQKAIDEAQKAISALKAIQEYVAHKRNETFSGVF
jgi:hypothetical protein